MPDRSRLPLYALLAANATSLLSILGDLTSAVAVAGIPLLHLAGVLEFWHLALLAFLGALFSACRPRCCSRGC